MLPAILQVQCLSLMPVTDSRPPLATITIDDIIKGLDQQKFTSVDLVRAYIARINEVNGIVNAVLEANPDALAIAHELDKERKLHGSRR
jgi:amidase